MIDTIKFLIPIKDANLLEQLKGSLHRFRKENLQDGKIAFEFFASNPELGSYNRSITIKVTNEPQGLFVEFSVPKYSKGNNVEMIYPHDLPKIMDSFYTDICTFMNYQLSHYSTWPVYRLDVCYNWLLNNKQEAELAMDFIQRIEYPRKQKYTYDTSVMYKGTAYTIKFYLKGAEFKKHDFKKINFETALQLQPFADRILRFEVNLKRGYLEEFLGLKNVYVADIAEDHLIEELLTFYLDKVFFYINPTSMTSLQVMDLLVKKFTKSKAMRLYIFYTNYYFNDDIKRKYLDGGLDRSTIYRNKKDLKEAGVGIAVEKTDAVKSVFERLIIPSLDTKFDLLDNGNIFKI